MQTLERATLSQRIARAIKDYIIDRRLKPGDKLPSEQELCRYFQASRIIVREALQALAAAGIISIQHGRGSFVEHFDGQTLAEWLTFGLTAEQDVIQQVLEVRTLVECGAIELATRRATPEDVQRLREILHRMGQAAMQGQALEEHDRAFHEAIIDATRNPVLGRLGGVVGSFFRLKSLSYPPSIVWRTPEAEVQEHAAILAAIEAGDAQEARHLLREALAIYPPPEPRDTA